MDIGLIADDLLNWQGGRDFFRMLYASLRSVANADDQLFVFSPPARDSLLWRSGRVVKHLPTWFPSDWRWAAAELRRKRRRAELRELLGSLAPRVQVLGHHERSSLSADVFGPLTSPLRSVQNVPWVGYLPDCQHRQMPGFFCRQEIVARDSQFLQVLSTANVVIVNSETTKSDLIKFYSPFRSEIISLPFSAAPDESWLTLNDYTVLERYSITRPFFLCSNQFWKHKNHRVVLDAIALSKQEGKKLNFIFTGALCEYRDRSYVPALLTHIQDLGIGSNCRFLGLIPKIDQIQLMKLSNAVVQPTLFEGGPGGGAIHDAIALGRPTIVSDLPVNREIEEYVSCFFDPTSPTQLLNALLGFEGVAVPSPEAETLRNAGAARRKHCGDALLRAFRRSIEINSNAAIV